MDTRNKIRVAARAAHEANRAYCLSLGDTSQQPWATAPQWQVQSAIAGVEAIVKNPRLTPQESHESWCAQKTADGWIYGVVKSEAARTHPCLVAYDALPPEQRLKDALFGAVVRGVMGIPVE